MIRFLILIFIIPSQLLPMESTTVGSKLSPDNYIRQLCIHLWPKIYNPLRRRDNPSLNVIRSEIELQIFWYEVENKIQLNDAKKKEIEPIILQGLERTLPKKSQ